jgi:3-methyladenine DNA glycosylase Mpg
MVIEVKQVKQGEWVLCRGQAIHVTAEEIKRAQMAAKKNRSSTLVRDRMRIVENISLGKRIGTYREWPRTKDEE